MFESDLSQLVECSKCHKKVSKYVCSYISDEVSINPNIHTILCPVCNSNTITVPICNYCGKPHYGRKKSEDRCWCDISGNFHYGEIEKEDK